MKKTVLALSGGMDSTTLLAMLLDQGDEVHAMIFYYGSKHNRWENQAARHVINYYQHKDFPLSEYSIDLSGVMQHFQSDLLLTGGDIPEGHYEDENMKQTVVPGRNMIFASILAGLTKSIGATQIALGVHSGDHHIYPDCRKEFIKTLDSAVYLSSGKTVEVTTPLIDDDKTSILLRGAALKVPYQLTRTCYKDQELSCGRCGACNERLEAFDAIGEHDPIPYEVPLGVM